MGARRRTKQASRNERKVNKRAAAKAEHVDRYANRPPNDPEMTAKLAALVAHFNGEEASR